MIYLVGSSSLVVVVAPDPKNKSAAPGKIIKRSILQLTARSFDQDALLPILIAKSSAQLFATVHLNLDKLRRHIIDILHGTVRLQSDLSSWQYNALLGETNYQFRMKQPRIAVLSALSNAFRSGLQLIELSWTLIAHEAKDEFVMELEGPPALWADDARQAWKKREASLKNHGRAILRSVAVSIHTEIRGNLDRWARERRRGHPPLLSNDEGHREKQFA